MPLCFLKIGAHQLEPTAWQCLQDTCSFFCLSSLTLLLLLLVLDSEFSFSAEFLTTIRTKIKASICHVRHCECSSSPCAWGAHTAWQGPPLAQVCLIPAGRATSLGWGILPTLCCEPGFTAFPHLQNALAASASPALYSAGFHPNKRRKETEKAVRQGSGRREFLLNSFSQAQFLFETVPIPVFITMHFSFDKYLFHFI